MATVQIWGSLKDATGGRSQIEIEAKNLRELLQELGRLFPDMGLDEPEQVSIAIDGRIFNDNWFQPISPDSEVVVLPRISGGLR